jgi:hypothetical protein
MTGRKVRSSGLEALCLLSFAGSGAGFLLYVAVLLFRDEALRIIDIYSSWDQPGLLTSRYFLLLAGGHLLSLAGVFLMWHQRSAGFFLYAGIQMALLLLPPLWLGKEAFSSVALIFTLLFTTGYARYFLHTGLNLKLRNPS